MGHDQLFKDFLRAFFREFLELFCPEAASSLDFGTLRFLDKELFTDFPEGSPREADVVAEIHTHDGTPELILVHIEVQLRSKPDFRLRMLQYYILLWLRYRKPIYPVAVYLKGGGEGVGIEQYSMNLFGLEHLRFRYRSLRLAKLDAWEYLEKSNPVGAALAALMRRKKGAESLTLRALMLQRVAESEVDAARKYLLVNLIETYFKLGPNEEESFRRLLSGAEYREAQKMEVTWADKIREEGRIEGREEGREEGLKAGLVKGKRETLRHLLTRKFGPLPQKTVSRLEALESLEELDIYLDRVLTAGSLEEMDL
jgi:predicted transposase/invertase (TIGR01784 family)